MTIPHLAVAVLGWLHYIRNCCDNQDYSSEFGRPIAMFRDVSVAKSIAGDHVIKRFVARLYPETVVLLVL
ncbi:hypothetical protein PISMIDRAFT_683152 [Pisolithus microcarpus 441]|uniref:Uncharacterized protein n=1 Tax=Pisolithus microcarpus 441 TaxID=765257 RepID=A0A0C9Y495_9AGAM|nr:hypothetical protein PISMIDRAFT_683152 [Pisolithus microcarpus 441]